MPLVGKEKNALPRFAGEQLKSRWKMDGFRARMGSIRNFLFSPARETIMTTRKNQPVASLSLTAEQEAEAQRLAEILMDKTKEEVLHMTRLLVSKADRDLLGETEFQVRDLVHKIGAQAIETAVNERKKRATKDRA
jgi:hypothetical protein